MRAIIVRKKIWGLQMLTWGWLARAKPELTKPKSTFRPQNFLSGLRAPHKQSFTFPTWAVLTRGQLLVCVSPGGSCGAVTSVCVTMGQLSPGAAVAWGGRRLGSCRRIM